MKNILAENMLRFGVKNLNETATSKVKQLAEQTPAPATKPMSSPAVQTVTVPTAMMMFYSKGNQDYVAETAAIISNMPNKENPNASAIQISALTFANDGKTSTIKLAPINIYGTQTREKFANIIVSNLEKQFNTLKPQIAKVCSEFNAQIKSYTVTGAGSTSNAVKQFEDRDLQTAWYQDTFNIANSILDYIDTNKKNYKGLIS